MAKLQTFLDQLFDQYHRRDFLFSDPLEFPHRYQDPWDQEAVALLSALLAYGNVRQIRRSVDEALRRIHSVAAGPREFIERIDPETAEPALAAFRGFVHRFNSGTDLTLLFLLLGRSWREKGSLGAHFVRYLEPGHETISGALDGLIADWRGWVRQDPRFRRLARRSPSFGYLLTAPRDGSCCKRWCMFLRWMGRQEAASEESRLDLGLWTRDGALARRTFPEGKWVDPSQLVIPLDTHTGRISQYLGLTTRKSLNWRAALEVTEALRRDCDARDPTRYDFALARLGILDLCQREYRAEICGSCALLTVCRFSSIHRKRSVS